MLDFLENKFYKIKEELIEACISEIIKIVRNEFKKGTVDNFMMAMGSVSFWKGDDNIYNYQCEELNNLLTRFDYLKLTGYGIKITKDKIITDW